MTDSFDRRRPTFGKAVPSGRKQQRAILPQDREATRLRVRGTLSLKSFWKAVDGD